MNRLTKSKIMTGLQCEKALWLAIHEPETMPPTTEAQQAIFDQGHEVGRVAQDRFPGGVLIDVPRSELGRAVELTRDAIARGERTIYEATFVHGGVLVRVDILHRQSAASPWLLYEVKSTTGLKDEHLTDIAIQSWVLDGAGIGQERVFLTHLNSSCVYPDLSELFVHEDVTDRVAERKRDVPAHVARLQAMLAGGVPRLDIGPHCDSPYECAFKERCWKEARIPELSILDLRGAGATKWALYRQGIRTLEDPRIELDSLRGVQRRMIEAARGAPRTVDRAAIAAFLSAARWPLYCLDFETFAPAIPRFVGTRPYQQIPFQFSCHRMDSANGAPVHSEYLHDVSSGGDPRPGLIEAMLAAIGPEGSIVSYNSGFEAGRLLEMAEAFPRHARALEALAERLIDPLPVMRAAVYDPGFLGSFSIKSVAPALLGERYGYGRLAIPDGTAASRAFDAMSRAGAEERARIRRELLEYCALDTEAMVALIRWMEAQ